MKISPKIDQELGGFEILKPYIYDRLELQLLNLNFGKIEESIFNIVNNVETLQTLVLHLPGCCYEIEDIISNTTQHNNLLNLLQCISSLKYKTNKNFKILAHCGWNSNYIISNEAIIGYLKFINGFLKMYEVELLLENTIDVYENLEDYDRACYICSKVDSPIINLCIDMSHITAISNRLGIPIKNINNYYRYLIPEKVDQIHFSCSLNGDGYKDMRTHGAMHPSYESSVFDYKILKMLGINDVYMVPEVMENDNDYSVRTCQHKEILYMKKTEKELE